MKIIHQLDQVSDLGLSNRDTPLLQAKLIQGFESLELAQAFWKDYGCSLIYLARSDQALALESTDYERIEFIVNYPEYATLIGVDEAYILALAIFTDEGAGSYLLMPLHEQKGYQSKLMQHITLNLDD